MGKLEIGRNGVEADHVARVEGRGGKSYKFKSPMRNNVPDRLDLLGLDGAAEQVRRLAALSGTHLTKRTCRKWARRIVAESVRFTECKAPGKKPRAGQEREHERLRLLGYRVDVVDG